jgi:hypothetical protein
MQHGESVKQFWDSIDRTVGAKIEKFALGELKGGFRGLPPSTVGMFFATEEGFYFHTRPKQSWFDSVLRNVRSKKKSDGPALLFTAPYDDIEDVTIHTDYSFLKRLFVHNLLPVTISFANDEGTEEELAFSLMSGTGGDELIAYIRARVPGTAV